jgi:hypothetical protein
MNTNHFPDLQAGSPSPTNRVSQSQVNALFALADTLDPAAIAEIRRRLTDDSEEVRFQAACFLAECRDDDGVLFGEQFALGTGKLRWPPRVKCCVRHDL